MKTNRILLVIGLLLITITGLLIISCQKDQSSSNDPYKINLISPSGEKIASSVSELNAQTSRTIYEEYGKNISFEIVSIQYFPVKVGYAYILTYKLQDGTIGNYAISWGNNYKLESSTLKVSKAEQNISLKSSLTYTKVKVSCSGTCDKACTVTAVFDTNTGTITYGCGCNTCTMTTELE